MEFLRKTKENGEILLYHPEGGSVALKPLDRELRILSIFTPEGQEERGIPLLLAAESLGYQMGMRTLVYDYLGVVEELTHMFTEAGFSIETKDPVVSFAIKDLIASTGVKKSMGLKFQNTEKYLFGDLMLYQLEEVVDRLKQHQFPVDMEMIDEYDDRLSAVAYDEETYTPKAVLLASTWESEIFVDLLCSFSAKKPDYTLAVCQSFLEGLVQERMYEDFPTMTMLAMNEGVLLLIKRLLDKNVDITERTRVLRATKEVKGGSDVFEDTDEELEEPVTSEYQKNLNEKYIWNFGKR